MLVDINNITMPVFLCSVKSVMTGKQVHLRIAAFSREDAQYQCSCVGFPVTVVDQLIPPVKLDNDLLEDVVFGRTSDL